MKKISRVFHKKTVDEMLKGIRKVKIFTIEKTKESVIVTHPKAGEVFRSLRNNGVWITRYNENLFV